LYGTDKKALVFRQTSSILPVSESENVTKQVLDCGGAGVAGEGGRVCRSCSHIIAHLLVRVSQFVTGFSSCCTKTSHASQHSTSSSSWQLERWV